MRLRLAIFPLLCGALIVYFAYHLFVGDHGIDARARLEMRAKTLHGELEGLRAVRARLDRDVSLLRAEHLDPDMLDERARAILNFAHPHDVVIIEPKSGTGARR